MMTAGWNGFKADLKRLAVCLSAGCAISQIAGAAPLESRQAEYEASAAAAAAACDADSDAARCAEAGRLHYNWADNYAWGEAREAALADADAYFVRACNLGSGENCAFMAEALKSGKVFEADEARAGNFLKLGCEVGHARSCVEAADLAGKGEAALPYLEQACALGEGQACLNAAETTHRYGGGSDAAIVLMETACTSGVGEACERLGALYTTGKAFGKSDLVQPDTGRARIYLEAACFDNDTAKACKSLATNYRVGDAETPIRPKQAELALQAKCRIEGKSDCPTDQELTLEILCAIEDASSCRQRAEEALGVRTPPNKFLYRIAYRYYSYGCQLENARSCKGLEQTIAAMDAAGYELPVLPPFFDADGAVETAPAPVRIPPKNEASALDELDAFFKEDLGAAPAGEADTAETPSFTDEELKCLMARDLAVDGAAVARAKYDELYTFFDDHGIPMHEWNLADPQNPIDDIADLLLPRDRGRAPAVQLTVKQGAPSFFVFSRTMGQIGFKCASLPLADINDHFWSLRFTPMIKFRDLTLNTSLSAAGNDVAGHFQSVPMNTYAQRANTLYWVLETDIAAAGQMQTFTQLMRTHANTNKMAVSSLTEESNLPYVPAAPCKNDFASVRCLETAKSSFDRAGGDAAGEAEAVGQLDKGCTYGNQDACGTLAYIYAMKPAHRDYARAFELGTASCNGGSATGCLSAASAWLDSGAHGIHDETTRQLFDKACNLGDEMGCSLLRQWAPGKAGR